MPLKSSLRYLIIKNVVLRTWAIKLKLKQRIKTKKGINITCSRKVALDAFYTFKSLWIKTKTQIKCICLKWLSLDFEQ